MTATLDTLVSAHIALLNELHTVSPVSVESLIICDKLADLDEQAGRLFQADEWENALVTAYLAADNR